MTPTPEQIAALAGNLPRLRRIAREAQNTYVGRHWPSMADMRRDGVGFGLVEDAAHERFIRRYLDTFQPAFVVDLLDQLAAVPGWTLVPTGKGLGPYWRKRIASLEAEVERLRTALEAS